MEPTGYPKTIRRVQCALIDGIIIPVAAVASLIIMTYSGVEDGYIKAVVAGFVILLLEPIAVSVTGGTIGHHLVGLRVRRIDSDKNINLFLAHIRFVVKVILGLFVFIAILVSRRRQGLHDLAARSVIVFKSTVGLPEQVMLKELTREREHHAFVSIWRRMLVILAYWCIGFVVWSLVLDIFVSLKCIEQTICTEMEGLLFLALTAVLILLTFVIPVLGWRGLLYGCRKNTSDSS